MQWDRISRTARVSALVGMCLVIVLLLLPAAITTSTGAAPPEFLERYRGWLWPAVIGLGAVALALFAWEWIRGGETSNRWSALDRVESRVRARLGASLATQSRIKLALARQPRVSVRVDDWEYEDFEALYTDVNQPITLLGEPGSGRTTLLLDLCLTLVKRARDDPEQPIPVVVDLASWSAYNARGETEFGTWLLRELTRRYGISRSAGTIWLRRKRLIVLIDGLDEVPDMDRAQCEYSLAPYATVVSSSRPLDDFVPVYVQPLTRGQVQEYIAAVSPRLDGLQTALEKDPAHWETLKSPLMLNLVALSYRDREADFPSDPVAGYVVERLAGQRAAGPTIRALKFLARLDRTDLVAPARLPARRTWIGLVPTRPLWLLFVRGTPAVLAGALGAVCAVLGARLGVVPAATCAVAGSGLVAWVSRLPHVFRPPGRAHGVIVASVGFLAGAVAGGAVAVLGLWLGSLGGRWPAPVAFSVVLLATFLLALGFVQGSAPLPWALLIMLVPALAMIWTGPFPVLTGIGVGLVIGVFGGVFCAAVSRVWRSVRPEQQARMQFARPWWIQPAIPVFGLLGSLTGLWSFSWGPALGVLIGLMITPTAARDYVWPFDVLSESCAELLARPLVLGELSLRRRSLLNLATDRLLLSYVDGEYRFVHSVLRDHLAACDPVSLAGLTRRV